MSSSDTDPDKTVVRGKPGSKPAASGRTAAKSGARTGVSGKGPAVSAASSRARLRAQQEAAAKQQRFNRIVGVGAGVVAALLVVVFVVVFIQNQPKVTPGATAVPGGAQIVPPSATDDKVGILVDKGKAKPGVPKVAIYLDYQCPSCRALEAYFGAEFEKLAASGEISLQYNTMTFLDVKLGNNSSTRAAIAAACADTVGKYAPYHDQTYLNQPLQEGAGYTEQQIRVDIPAAAGITGDNLVKFQQCYDSRATADYVKGTDEAATKAGITGTPTITVNGKTVDNKLLPQEASGLKAFILEQAAAAR